LAAEDESKVEVDFWQKQLRPFLAELDAATVRRLADHRELSILSGASCDPLNPSLPLGLHYSLRFASEQRAESFAAPETGQDRDFPRPAAHPLLPPARDVVLQRLLSQQQRLKQVLTHNFEMRKSVALALKLVYDRRRALELPLVALAKQIDVVFEEGALEAARNSLITFPASSGELRALGANVAPRIAREQERKLARAATDSRYRASWHALLPAVHARITHAADTHVDLIRHLLDVKPVADTDPDADVDADDGSGSDGDGYLDVRSPRKAATAGASSPAPSPAAFGHPPVLDKLGLVADPPAAAIAAGAAGGARLARLAPVPEAPSPAVYQDVDLELKARAAKQFCSAYLSVTSPVVGPLIPAPPQEYSDAGVTATEYLFFHLGKAGALPTPQMCDRVQQEVAAKLQRSRLVASVTQARRQEPSGRAGRQLTAEERAAFLPRFTGPGRHVARRCRSMLQLAMLSGEVAPPSDVPPAALPTTFSRYGMFTPEYAERKLQRAVENSVPAASAAISVADRDLPADLDPILHPRPCSLRAAPGETCGGGRAAG
jgi:hypothetical protein